MIWAVFDHNDIAVYFIIPQFTDFQSAPAPPRRCGGLVFGNSHTHGSGECIGEDACRMYWVHWNTRNAKLARKSLAESSPATGRRVNPVRSACACGGGGGGGGRNPKSGTVTSPKELPQLNKFHHFLSRCVPLRKRDTSSNWGMLSGL